MKKSRFIEIAGSLVLGLIFVYAGVLKAWEPAGFAQEVYNYRLLPWTGAVAVSLYLPWLELVCGLSLLSRKAERGAIAIMLLLCLVFLAVLVSAVVRGLNISCGCFGGESSSLGLAIVRDVFLLAAVIGFQFQMRRTRN